MNPPQDRPNETVDDVSPPPAGVEPDTPDEAVTGVIRVGRLTEQAAAAAAPVPLTENGGLEPRALANVSFPTVWRGYDTAAVDAYVRQVSRTVAELEATSTPQEVVRRALDRVGEQTSAILREAEEAAQRITTKSRADAVERVQASEREAHEITQRARVRLRELDADIDRIWVERQRIIDDTRKLAQGLELIAAHAEERFPAEELEVLPGAASQPGKLPPEDGQDAGADDDSEGPAAPATNGRMAARAGGAKEAAAGQLESVADSGPDDDAPTEPAGRPSKKEKD